MNTVHYTCSVPDPIRRQRQRDELANLILEGARRVFEREGHDKLSIRKVAREIDYSPGTIYLHYKDKDALMLALHEDAFARKANRFAPLMHVDDPMERLVAMGRSYIEHALAAPSDFHLMFVDGCPINAMLEAGQEWNVHNDAFLMLQATVQEGIDQGRFRENLEAESTAVMLWSMVHGHAMLTLSRRLDMLTEESRARVRDAMFDQMRQLLAATPVHR